MRMSGRTRTLLAAAVVALPLVGVPLAEAAKASCAPVKHAGGEWRSYGHDDANTRTQEREKTIGPVEAATLAPAWTFSADDAGGSGDFTGTPVIADGCLFVGSNDGWVFAANADTGAPVWSTQLKKGGGVNSSVTVDAGRVYVGVSRIGSPYIAALDQRTGKVLWETTIDTQPGSDTYASPVIFDGVIMTGASGGSAELGDETDRYAFQGSITYIETGSSPRSTKKPGTVLKKTWTVHSPKLNSKDEYAGAAVWSTPAVDPKAKVAYVGAGNPFRPQAEHKHANSLLKIDVDRTSKRFGEIIGFYKGTPDEYVPGFSDLPCYDIEGNPAPYYPQGIGECGDLDMDFGASPNLFTIDGRKVVGIGQKSGIYHVVDAKTMKPVWTSIVGAPTAVGGIVGSTAIADGNVFGPITTGGYVWSLAQKTGGQRWVMPTADGAHWGNPVAVANGVVYTVDLKGFLDAYDAATGAPLLHRSMMLGGKVAPMASWGGVAIARNTVYAAVGMTGLPNGHVVAFRPGASGGGGGGLPGGPPGGGGGGSGTRIVSGPQGQFYGYVTPAMVASKSGELLYDNFDIVKHDVVQDPRTDGVSGPAKSKWCGNFPAGKCPVFWSEQAGLGETVPVEGLENTEVGKTYTFYCTLHPGMKGKLSIVE